MLRSPETSEEPPKENTETTEASEAAASEKLSAVDETHPEVAAMVEQAVKNAEALSVTLPPEAWIDAMELAIKEHEEEMRMNNPTGPM